MARAEPREVGERRDVREQLADGTLIAEVRRLIDTGAAERLRWIRANTRTAMAASGQDAVTLSALTGVAVGTVKGFLASTDTSIKNVLLIAVALGLTVAELERTPAEFAELMLSRPTPGSQEPPAYDLSRRRIDD